MKTFTDLLDNYLLALGKFNQLYALNEADPLRFGQDYRQASTELVAAKKELNEFFFEPEQTPAA